MERIKVEKDFEIKIPKEIINKLNIKLKDTLILNTIENDCICIFKK